MLVRPGRALPLKRRQMLKFVGPSGLSGARPPVLQRRLFFYAVSGPRPRRRILLNLLEHVIVTGTWRLPCRAVYFYQSRSDRAPPSARRRSRLPSDCGGRARVWGRRRPSGPAIARSSPRSAPAFARPARQAGTCCLCLYRVFCSCLTRAGVCTVLLHGSSASREATFDSDSLQYDECYSRGPRTWLWATPSTACASDAAGVKCAC